MSFFFSEKLFEDDKATEAAAGVRKECCNGEELESILEEEEVIFVVVAFVCWSASIAIEVNFCRKDNEFIVCVQTSAGGKVHWRSYR